MSAFEAELDDFLERTLEEFRVPGAVVAAVRGDELFLKSYGCASNETRAPVTSKTAFNIASNTKAFLVTLLARLVEQGRLAWDDRVETLLPEFDIYDPWLRHEVRLRDLCSNRLGLSRVGLVEFGADPSVSRATLLQRIRHLPPAAPFRTRFTYLNVGFLAAAAIVERITGETLADCLENMLLQPLGMTCSAAGLRAANLTDRAAPHVGTATGPRAVDAQFSDTYLGASSLYVCAEDALAWLRLHACTGKDASSRIIGMEALRETYTPQIVITGGDRAVWLGEPGSPVIAYALGWSASTFAGRKLLCHAGLELGATAQTCVLPEDEIGVVVYAANVSPAPQILAYGVLDWLLKGPRRDWNRIVMDPALPSPLPPEHARMLAPAQNPAFSRAGEFDSFCGKYFSDTSGAALVTKTAGGLQLTVEESVLYSGALSPLGGDTFGAYGANSALVEMIGGTPRVEFERRGNTVQGFRVAWLGDFRRLA